MSEPIPHRTPPVTLRETVGLDTLAALADGLASSISVPVAICDTLGQPLTEGFQTPPFCELLGCRAERLTEQMQSALRTVSADGETDATAHDLRCPAGLSRILVPIGNGVRRLGWILAGDRPESPVDTLEPTQLAVLRGLSPAALASAASSLPTWPQSARQAAAAQLNVTATLLSELCAREANHRQRVEDLGMVSDIAEMVAGDEDLQTILDATTRIVTIVMQADACSLRLLEPATGELRIRSVFNLSAAYLDKGPVLVMENRIDAAALAGEAVYVPDVTRDPRTRYPQQSADEGLVSSLVVGMAYHDRPLGVVRVYTHRLHRFSPLEITLLRAVAAQAAVAIANRQLRSDAHEAELYERQLRYAGEVQRRMIPSKQPAHPNVEFAGVYSPSVEVGGDFYDYIELPDGQLGVAICDVVGHGVAASLLMSSIRASLRAYCLADPTVEAAIADVNAAMCRDTLTSEFATLFYGVFSADGRTLTYCNAGHEPPLLLRGGKMTQLEVSGPAIGILTTFTYERMTQELEPGDVLLLFTDGVPEAMNFHDEYYGRDRLKAALLEFEPLPTRVLPRQVQWDVKRFMGLSGQPDDITIVAARIN